MMFTVKYRTFVLAHQQPTEGPQCFVQHEQLHGPFSMVSQEIDEDGYYVVRCHRNDAEPGMTFGPWIPMKDAQSCQHPGPTVWVMNEAGATVATYHI